MEAALALIALLALSGMSSPGEPQGSGAGAAPPPKPKQPEDTTVADVLGVAGSVVAVVAPLIAGALGGGGAAVGAGAAAGGTTAVVAGGAAGGGGAGGAGGAGTAAGVVGGVGTAAAGSGAVAAGAFVPLIIIVLFIIADKINQGQEADKDWGSMLGELDWNARSLHQFEEVATQAMLTAGGVSYSTEQVRDARLDFRLMGSKVVFRGYRTVYRFVPTAEAMRAFRRLRAIAYEYLRLRSMYGSRLVQRVKGSVSSNWGWTKERAFALYDSLQPGLGGIYSLPAAANGETVTPRSDSGDENADPFEQISSGRYTAPQPGESIVLSPGELQVAKLAALVSVLKVLRWDPRVAAEADQEAYARDIFAGLGWLGVPPEGVTLEGSRLRLSAAVYGRGGIVSPAKLKLGDSRAWAWDATSSPAAGPPPQEPAAPPPAPGTFSGGVVKLAGAQVFP